MKDIFSMEECLKELKKIYDETVEIQKDWKDKGSEAAEIELKFLKQRKEVIRLILKKHEEIKKEKDESIPTVEEVVKMVEALKKRDKELRDQLNKLGHKS